MPSVYDEENYQGRINFAAKYIAQGRRTTRHFDTCFEMWDGDFVATALYRRAQKNPKLAAALPRYLNLDSIKATAEKYKDLSTSGLAKAAAEERAKQRKATT